LQQTGYPDATQAEIYEMDVVQVGLNYMERTGQYGLVTMLDGCYVVLFGDKDEEGMLIQTLHHIHHAVQVVGCYYSLAHSQATGPPLL
jgi:YopX protein